MGQHVTIRSNIAKLIGLCSGLLELAIELTLIAFLLGVYDETISPHITATNHSAQFQ